MNELKPIEVSEFACDCGIGAQPAFQWWVPYTLRKRDRIIEAVNLRVAKTTHKYGIEVPRTVAEALKLDVINDNDLWGNAIQKEMDNVKIAFDILSDDQELPSGYKKASGHSIFDVQMTLEWKA